MLPPAYLSRKLDRPLPTKDGGTLRTIRDACDYMTGHGSQARAAPPMAAGREAHLSKADVSTVSQALGLALLYDAKLDVAKVSAK